MAEYFFGLSADDRRDAWNTRAIKRDALRIYLKRMCGSCVPPCWMTRYC